MVEKTTTPVPGRWVKGQPITADRLNEVVAYVAQALRGVGVPRQINPNAAAASPEVRRFKVSAIKPDYLECNTWDGVNTGTATVYVARPPRLRASEESRTFSGGTVTYSAVSATGATRTATVSGDDEPQVVVPEYVVGDEIFAVRNVTGKTGVVRTVNGDEIPVDWLDMNVDGRAWAKSA